VSRQLLSDEEFAQAMRTHGTVAAVAKVYGVDTRHLHRRRAKLAKTGVILHTRATTATAAANVPMEYRPDSDAWTFPRQKDLWLHTGVAVVFSDAHYWPGDASLAHRALVEVIKATKPRVIFANGDIFDGGGLSRFPAAGWSTRPGPVDELHACQERLGEIEQAAPRGCELLWNIGNHDVRWERILASQVDQFAGLHGLRLGDHFPAWEMLWSTMVNGGEPHPVMVKHRFNNGVHSGYNDVLRSGLSIVTGHTHGLSITPFGDYRGRRWGVKTGSLADLHGAQFEYHENNPSPQCAGFAVLTFENGGMVPPELCEVIGGKAWFRGQVVAHDG
jgi:hypothetical protein